MMQLTSAKVTLLNAFLTILNANSILAQVTPTPAAESTPPKSDNIVQTHIHSSVLGEDRSVIIHLPRNYKMSEFLLGASGLKGFLYVSVGDKETDQMIGGFSKLVDVLKKNRKKQFKWAAYRAPYAVHQDNALISTSKGLAEWGRVLSEIK